MEFARIEGRCDLAKVPGSKVVAEAAVLIAATKLRVVPRIESVSPELKPCAARLADQEALKQREIPIIASGSTQRVEGEVAPGSRSRSRECSGVHPLNSGYNSVAGNWRLRVRDFPYQVWPVRDIAAREETGDVATIDAQIERNTRFHSDDAGERPSAYNCLHEVAGAVPRKWDVINEVNECDIGTVEDRWTDVVFPAHIRIGDVIQVEAVSAITGCGID